MARKRRANDLSVQELNNLGLHIRHLQGKVLRVLDKETEKLSKNLNLDAADIIDAFWDSI